MSAEGLQLFGRQQDFGACVYREFSCHSLIFTLRVGLLTEASRNPMSQERQGPDKDSRIGFIGIPV